MNCSIKKQHYDVKICVDGVRRCHFIQTTDDINDIEELLKNEEVLSEIKRAMLLIIGKLERTIVEIDNGEIKTW
ncbi:MAG: hypothetical protein ACE5RC_09210 [Nitrosopumilus sp.]